MATDAYYVAPISLSAHLHSAAGSRVFMYVNNYEFGRGSSKRLFPDWMSMFFLLFLIVLAFVLNVIHVSPIFF